ncbi:MAG: carbohydrate kinase family protein [bacterium]|nr:carbohydrate kinase family protein [bacterium]
MSVSVFSRLNLDIIYSGIDRLPEKGEEIYSDHFDIQLGGGAPVLPIVLKRLNVKGKLGTFLSDDLVSTLAKNLLKKLDFDDYYNFYKKSGNPVIVTSVISFSDDRSFVSFEDDRGETLCTEQEVYDFFTGSKVCWALGEYPEAMAKLKKEGTTLVYDIGWDGVKHVSNYKDILSIVDVFTPNDKEAMAITETSNAKDAVKILSEYVKHPIVKIGKDGCLTYKNGKVIQVGLPYKVKAIETTGAGDNFLAGLTYGLDKDWCIEDCMKMGNIIGANSTTELGCYKAYLSEEEALNYFHM